MTRARNGGDGRGSAADRRARKAWLLSPVAGFGGDGLTVPCRWCGARLGLGALTVDRWPKCGHDGGRYARGNVVPACAACNFSRCNRTGAACRHKEAG
jgi:hypothetical protein